MEGITASSRRHAVGARPCSSTSRWTRPTARTPSVLRRDRPRGDPPENILWNFLAGARAWRSAAAGLERRSSRPRRRRQITNGTYRGRSRRRATSTGQRRRLRAPALRRLPAAGAAAAGAVGNLSLASLCTDPLTRQPRAASANTDATAYGPLGGQRLRPERRVPARPSRTRSSTSRAATSVHHIVVTSGSTTVERRRPRNRCAGAIIVSKAVTGEGIPPPGPWAIVVRAAMAFSQTVDARRRSAGDREGPGALPGPDRRHRQGRRGVRYTISEPDPLGAIASVDKSPVTILDGQSQHVTVGNDSRRRPSRRCRPSRRSRRSAARSRRSRRVRSTRCRDPTSCSRPRWPAGRTWRSARRCHPASAGGRVVSVTTRVRNIGPLPAVDGAIAREIPQVDPAAPTRWRGSSA